MKVLEIFDFPDKRYNTIVIDPAWDIPLTGSFNLRENRADKLPYKTMTLQEIKEIPIHKIANIGCHVYCWTTNKMLKDTFNVFKSWGVNFHLVLVWCKPSFIAPCLAYQFATEFCLLGFFGKPMLKFNGKVNVNWIKATQSRNNHSSKPNEFYNLIRDMSPEPRIDIFSRRVIAGFDSFGDEAINEKQKMVGDFEKV